MSVTLTEARNVSAVVEEAIALHGDKPDAVIPVLSEVNEKLGYLPVDALTQISKALRVPGSKLLSTASFYRLLSTEPRGAHVIRFCESAPCHVVGGRRIWEALQDTLGVGPGETTEDGKWTLLAASCPGICGVGPVIMIDDDVYGNVAPDRVPDILALYE
jgi:NADH:ubiquinone oxidoreductase subunit E